MKYWKSALVFSRVCALSVLRNILCILIKKCNRNKLNVDPMIDVSFDDLFFVSIKWNVSPLRRMPFSVHEFIKRFTIKTAAARKDDDWESTTCVMKVSLFCSNVFYSLKWFHFRTATSSHRVNVHYRISLYIYWRKSSFYGSYKRWFLVHKRYMWDDDLRHVIPMRECSSIAYTVYCQCTKYIDGSYKDYWRVCT